MAENVPPTAGAAAATTTASSASDQPGRPYYESLRSTLRQTLEKKRRLDEQLAALEDSIFKSEGTYLEETANSGNIVRGFDGWVKGVQAGGAGGRGGDDRRRGRVREDDRVFSRSSATWMKAQEGSDSNTTSAAPTPSASGAPNLRDGHTPGAGNKSGNKKKRPQEKDEDDDVKTNKRGKITYVRD